MGRWGEKGRGEEWQGLAAGGVLGCKKSTDDEDGDGRGRG